MTAGVVDTARQSEEEDRREAVINHPACNCCSTREPFEFLIPSGRLTEGPDEAGTGREESGFNRNSEEVDRGKRPKDCTVKLYPTRGRSAEETDCCCLCSQPQVTDCTSGHSLPKLL